MRSRGSDLAEIWVVVTLAEVMTVAVGVMTMAAAKTAAVTTAVMDATARSCKEGGGGGRAR